MTEVIVQIIKLKKKEEVAFNDNDAKFFRVNKYCGQLGVCGSKNLVP